MKISEENYDQLVGKIYDCAANPTLWPGAIESVRQIINAAYILVGLTDESATANGGIPTFNYWNTSWDKSWLNDLVPRLKDIPRIESLYNGEIDTVWLQLDHLSEVEFSKTAFFNEWVKPQGLYDTCNIVTMRRDKMIGMFTAPIRNDRPRYSPDEISLMTRLAPHIRRSMSIADMVDKGRLSVTLYQSVLDTLSVAVVLLGHAGRIVYANAAAERLFEENTIIMRSGGALIPKRAEIRLALSDAIARALRGDQAIGISGIGIPLMGTESEQAAAYILPIGASDVRNISGNSHVAVFITKRSEQQPALIEILRTVFNLTLAEARTVMHLVKGETSNNTAKALGVSIHTVRTHLAHSFAKTGTTDQGNLIALVNSVLPPVML
jgi:DNA-binding CsgD family transcriptional regulator/PAS domain-containing protein